VRAGRRLFGERGFGDVSAGEAAREAGVTTGALYHHFGDKTGLFRAVLEDLEREITAETVAGIPGGDDPLAAMAVGLSAFLDICQRPEVVRITLTDAPAVLGWQEWREVEARHGLGVITDTLRQAAAAGAIVDAPIGPLAQLMLSSINETVLMIAHADDPAAARAEAEPALIALLAGLAAPQQ
jgi:AcrR family transcriptional regulator